MGAGRELCVPQPREPWQCSLQISFPHPQKEELAFLKLRGSRVLQPGSQGWEALLRGALLECSQKCQPPNLFLRERELQMLPARGASNSPAGEDGSSCFLPCFSLIRDRLRGRQGAGEGTCMSPRRKQNWTALLVREAAGLPPTSEHLKICAETLEEKSLFVAIAL